MAMTRQQEIKFETYCDLGFSIMFYKDNGSIVMRPKTFIMDDVVEIDRCGKIQNYTKSNT